MGKNHRCHNNCVCETVEEIIRAQNKVANEINSCRSGCEQSIRDLLSPSQRPTNTTIPFILYCKGSCKAFIASGVYKRPIKNYPDESYYDCLETPILRAKKFINNDCCVQVELLRPVNANGYPVADSGEKLCDFFCDKTPHKTIQFRETGICLILDLNDFNGISCLDATTPLPRYKAC